MDEEELEKLMKEIKLLSKDLPDMVEISNTVNEKFVKMLEDVNSYLIDKRVEIKSNTARQSIDRIIASNFKLLIETKEGGNDRNG